jgi:Rap1a immunity proteins
MHTKPLLCAAAALTWLLVPLAGRAAEPASRLSQPLSPSQNVVIENTNISTGEFWAAYTSENLEHRRRAELFLLGILDATEGVTWCDYGKYKTITIDEKIYGQLKRLAGDGRDERAARSIVRILSKSFPCGGKK